MRLPAAVFALVLALCPAAARADSPFAVSGLLAARVEFDRERIDTTVAPSTRSVAFAKAFLQGRVRHVETGFFLQGAIALEVTRDPGGSFYFAGQDAYVQQAMLGWETNVWRAYAGKFRPNFGKAPAEAPGLFGTDSSSVAYELLERVGFGLSWAGDPRSWGAPTLEASVFTLDVTALSTAFFNRQRATQPGVYRPSPHRLGDGGVGNTGRLDNALLSVEVAGFAGVDGLMFTGGLMRLGEGHDGGGEQWRQIASLQWRRAFDDGPVLKTIAEAARLARKTGSHGFLTLGAGLTFGDWTPSLVATAHPHGSDSRGYADFTLATGLEWRVASVAGGNLFLDVGSKSEWLPDGRRDTLGAAITFFRTF